jgi:hypothetical protein
MSVIGLEALYSDGIRKSSLRIGIEGRLHFLGLI